MPDDENKKKGNPWIFMVIFFIWGLGAVFSELEKNGNGDEIWMIVAGFIPFIIVFLAIFMILKNKNKFTEIIRNLNKGNLQAIVEDKKSINLAQHISIEQAKWNPPLLKEMISEKVTNKEKMLLEIDKIIKIKKIKKAEDGASTDFLGVYNDESEHWYRVCMIDENGTQKIISLTRYS